MMMLPVLGKSGCNTTGLVTNIEGGDVVIADGLDQFFEESEMGLDKSCRNGIL
jgi:hypothetical protein